jgi:hypothetical protein
MIALWEVSVTVQGKAQRFIGSYWWDGKLRSLIVLPDAAQLGDIVARVRDELLSGERECTPGPPPASPVPYDESNPDHAMFLLMQCHGMPCDGGHIRMTVETVGPRKVEPVRPGQPVY